MAKKDNFIYDFIGDFKSEKQAKSRAKKLPNPRITPMPISSKKTKTSRLVYRLEKGRLPTQK